MTEKNFYIIAGCNGAGKTTAAYKLFPHLLESSEFLNADEFARELRKTDPGTTDIAAGREMLKRIEEMISSGKSFTVETTLASKSLAGIIRKAKHAEYRISLIYFWLDSPSLSIERVRSRVEIGGHSIPEKIIKRRYYGGLRNLFGQYIFQADEWTIYNNSKLIPEIIAGGSTEYIEIKKSLTFALMLETYNNLTHG